MLSCYVGAMDLRLEEAGEWRALFLDAAWKDGKGGERMREQKHKNPVDWEIFFLGDIPHTTKFPFECVHFSGDVGKYSTFTGDIFWERLLTVNLTFHLDMTWVETTSVSRSGFITFKPCQKWLVFGGLLCETNLGTVNNPDLQRLKTNCLSPKNRNHIRRCHSLQSAVVLFLPGLPARCGSWKNILWNKSTGVNL